MEQSRRLSRAWVTAVVLLVVVPVVWAEAGRIQAWVLRRTGDHLYAAGDALGALRRYERIERMLPALPASHTNPADTIRDLLVSEEGRGLDLETFRELVIRGVRHYLRAIETGPPNAWAYSGVAELTRALGRQQVHRETTALGALAADPLEALRPVDRLEEAVWVKAVQIEPRNYYYREILGDYYWRHGFKQRALAHFRAALSLQPILDNYFYVGQWAQSEPEVLQVVEEGIDEALQRPDSETPREEIHTSLGRLYLGLGRTADARAEFQAARETAPPEMLAPLDVQIGQLLGAEGDDEGALSSFREAAERAPEYYRAWVHLGQALSRLGRHTEAIAALKKARGLSPREFQPAWLLAQALERAGDEDEAVKLLEQLIRSHGDRQQPYFRLIALYRRGGRPTDAVRVARLLAERYPDEPVFQEQVQQLEEQARGR